MSDKDFTAALEAARAESIAKHADLAKLLTHWHRLGPDEHRLLILVAERLAAGREHYGPLDLSKETRDFRAEAGEELLDAVAYLAMAALRPIVCGSKHLQRDMRCLLPAGHGPYKGYKDWHAAIDAEGTLFSWPGRAWLYEKTPAAPSAPRYCRDCNAPVPIDDKCRNCGSFSWYESPTAPSAPQAPAQGGSVSVPGVDPTACSACGFPAHGRQDWSGACQGEDDVG